MHFHLLAQSLDLGRGRFRARAARSGQLSLWGREQYWLLGTLLVLLLVVRHAWMPRSRLVLLLACWEGDLSSTTDIRK